MLPSKVGDDACVLARRWTLDPTLSAMLVSLEGWARVEIAKSGLRWPGINIISGYRSSARQADLNPDAPNSLHTRCPSLAADLSVGSIAVGSDAIWELLGGRWKWMGGRWGGNFSFTGSTPGMVNRREQNHFDLG